MQLSLEELVILSNTPKEYTDDETKAGKWNIAYESYLMLNNPKHSTASLTFQIDELVIKGLVTKENHMLFISKKGLKALKESYNELQMMIMSIYTKIS